MQDLAAGVSCDVPLSVVANGFEFEQCGRLDFHLSHHKALGA